MIFKIPDLKGYIEYEDGKFTAHDADPELRYMKLLMDIAQEFVKLWMEVDYD